MKLMSGYMKPLVKVIKNSFSIFEGEFLVMY